MKAFTFLVLLAGCFLFGCGKKEKSASASTNTTSASGNPLTAPADYGHALVKSRQLTSKVAGEAGLNQTIKLFESQEGRLPKKLEELVSPDYLSKLPDPPQGMKFDYDSQTGKVKVVPK